MKICTLFLKLQKHFFKILDTKYTIEKYRIISHRCTLIPWKKNIIPFARALPLPPPPLLSSGSQNGSAPSPLVAHKPSKFFTLSAVSFEAEKSGDISLQGARPNLRSTNCDELCTFERKGRSALHFEFTKTR